MSFCNYYLFFFLLFVSSSSWSSSLLFCPSVDAQHTYINNKQLDCDNNLSITNGYLCNGAQRSCNSYLTFRSQPPYDTATDIGYLLGSLPLEIAAINSISYDYISTDTLVIVPVTCSCSGGGGGYYQHNSSYRLKVPSESYFSVANDTYQGLTTCQALMSQNPVDSRKMIPDFKLTVPLRCACPTRNQTDAGIRFLLTYMVTWGDSISSIAETFFGGSSSNNKEEEEQNINEANKLSGDSSIFPFTTLLVPFKIQPTITKTTPNRTRPLPPNTICK